MKFTCEQGKLSQMLGIVRHAVAKGTGTLPIATNIRLSTSTDQTRLRLDATNLSIGLTGWVDATIDEGGAVAIPATLFVDLINALPAGTIEVSSDAAYNVKVLANGQRAHLDVRGLDPSEFPLMPDAQAAEKPTLLKAVALKEMIKEVSTAADGSGGRDLFDNILLQITPEQITFAGADGSWRMAFRTLPLATPGELTRDILVPVTSLTELATILPNEGMVELRLTPNNSQVIFRTHTMVLSSILASGEFPDYKAAVPPEPQTRVTVKTATLREVVQLVALIAKADGDAGHISITASRGVEPGALTIAAQAADVGGTSRTISAVVEGTNQQDVTFNMAYLTKVLSAISASDLIFEVGVKKAPVGVIRATGPHTCTHLFGSMGNAH